jgi:gas vesicle protein
MNTAGKVMVGVLAGATVGLLTGILIAPDSGKKTRELKNKMADSFDEVKKTYNKKVEAFAGEGKSSIDYLKDTLKV